MERNDLQSIERLLFEDRAKLPASLRESLLLKIENARSQTRWRRHFCGALGVLFLTMLLAVGSLGYQNRRITRLILSNNDRMNDFNQSENNDDRKLSNPK